MPLPIGPVIAVVVAISTKIYREIDSYFEDKKFEKNKNDIENSNEDTSENPSNKMKATNI